MAGGGRGGHSGRVVLWDVKSGKRIAEVGNEYDVVLAADISPDHTQVALGGPKKIVRVYDTSTGELLYEKNKHTDWITAIEFSPDGVLLATADRSNGLVVWEAFTGREFYFLTVFLISKNIGKFIGGSISRLLHLFQHIIAYPVRQAIYKR